MADEISIIVKAEDQFSGVLSNFGNIITGIKSAIDLAAGAFKAAGDFVGQFVDSASESQLALVNLEATVKSTGGAAGYTAQQLSDMASGFQSVTRFSDETIANGEAMLLTFTSIGHDIFPQATEAMLNLAEKFGSVDAASVQLGKALNDPINGVTALRRVGVQLTDQQEESIKKFVEQGDIMSAQKIILGELQTEFGGLAKAMGETFAGQMDIAKNKLDDMKETIGNAFLPVLTDLFQRFNAFVSSPQFVAFFSDLADSISKFLTSLDLGTKLTSFLSDIQNAMSTGNWSTVWNDLVTGFQIVWNTIVTWVQGKIAEFKPIVSTWFSNITGGLDFGGVIQNFIDTLQNKISTTDWSKVGQTVGNFVVDVGTKAITTLLQGLDVIVNQVDWGPFGKALWNAIKEAISGVFKSSLGPVLHDSLQQAATAPLAPILLTGLKIYLGALELLTSIESWVNQYIITPIKKFLGIGSPSTVFYDIGRDLIQGLVNGISAMTSSITNTILNIAQAILGPLQPILDLLGIDVNLGGTSTGTIGGKTGSGGTGTTGSVGGGVNPGTGTGGAVTNNYYGPVYFVGAGEPGAYYECPQPNPFIAGSNGGIVTSPLG